uniref:helix-turn-helix domain-containing protein n=1 Tax=uncultured Secundilactobacillus sp. TaxID=2813935 RepID=UPI00258907B6
EVATILHITRQAISKWENGRSYPDIDNLVYLSGLYSVSIDQLLKENDELKDRININKQEIDEKRKALKEVNTQLYQNTDEGVLLLVLSIVSTVLAPVGLVLPCYVMWRNTKFNSLHKTIYVVSILVVIFSAIAIGIFLSDNWLEPTHTEIYRVN